MVQWTADNQVLISWFAAGSFAMFVGSLILVPWIIVRIPANYFAHHKRQQAAWQDQHTIVRGLFLGLKNLLGILFIFIGGILLIFPGQGLLTILAGLLLLDFPGKFRLERYLITRRPVLDSINWLRRRHAQPPLEIQE